MDKELDFLSRRVDRLEDRLNSVMDHYEGRIGALERNLSQARGWITACLSIIGIAGAFILEWFRRQIFG